MTVRPASMAPVERHVMEMLAALVIKPVAITANAQSPSNAMLMKIASAPDIVRRPVSAIVPVYAMMTAPAPEIAWLADVPSVHPVSTRWTVIQGEPA